MTIYDGFRLLKNAFIAFCLVVLIDMRVRLWFPLGFILLNAVLWGTWGYARWCDLSDFVRYGYLPLIGVYLAASGVIVKIKQLEERGPKRDFHVFSLFSPEEIFRHLSLLMRKSPYKGLVDKEIKKNIPFPSDSQKMVLFYGRNGSGKTHALHLFVEELVRREKLRFSQKGFRARWAYRFRRWVGRGTRVLLPKGGRQQYFVPENIKYNVVLVWDDIHLLDKTSTFLDVVRGFHDTLSVKNRDFVVAGSYRSQVREKVEKEIFASELKFSFVELVPWKAEELGDLVDYCSENFFRLNVNLRRRLLGKCWVAERTPGYVVSAFWILKDLQREKAIEVEDIEALPSTSMDIWRVYAERLIEKDRRYERFFRVLRNFYRFMPSVRKSFIRRVFCEQYDPDGSVFDALWEDLLKLRWIRQYDIKEAVVWETAVNGIEKCVGSTADRDELLRLARIVSKPQIESGEDKVWVSWALNSIGHHFAAQLKDYNEAKKLFEKAWKLNPASAFIESNLGQAFSDLSKLESDADRMKRLQDKAESHFKHVLLELKEDDPTIHFNYAILLERLGRHKDAEKHYKQALQLKEDQPETMANLGFLYLEQDKLRDALEWLFKALQRRENLPDKGQRILKQISTAILTITQSNTTLKNKQAIIKTIEQNLQTALDKSTYKTFINKTVQQLRKHKTKPKTTSKIIKQLLKGNNELDHNQ